MSVVAVYDTMLFLQAAARPSRTHATFRAVETGRVTLAFSAELLAEVQDVLSRPSIRDRFPALTPEAVEVFIGDILAHGLLLPSVPHVYTWPRHTDDDHLFNLAIHAQARYLVTWETRILRLANERTASADLLRKLAPALSILTPPQLISAIGL